MIAMNQGIRRAVLGGFNLGLGLGMSFVGFHLGPLLMANGLVVALAAFDDA